VRRKAKAIGRQRLTVTNHELVAREVQVVDAQLPALLPARPSRVKEAGHQAI